jgi:hypothetical protein
MVMRTKRTRLPSASVSGSDFRRPSQHTPQGLAEICQSAELGTTEAYIVIDQYCENLLMAGEELGTGMPEHRRVVVMPHQRATFVANMNVDLAKTMNRVMNMLNRYLD